MPRPKKPGSAEPKKRSRNGCWPCKNRKIKCGEERPHCSNCERQGETCDYSIRLNWEGRTKRKAGDEKQPSSTASSPQPPPKLGRSISSTSAGSDHTIRCSSPNSTGGLVVNQFGSSNPPVIFQAQPRLRDHISTAQLSRIRDRSVGPYPSPADSNGESPLPKPPTLRYDGHQHLLPNSEMPPPFPHTVPQIPHYSNTHSNAFTDHQAKRIRLSPSVDKSEMYEKLRGTNSFVPTNTMFSMGPLTSPPIVHYPATSPSSTNLRVPPTPAASVGSDDGQNPVPGPSPQSLPQESPDFRRLSVKSLLSDESHESTSGSENTFPGKLHISDTSKIDHGTDRGLKDLDLPRNDDSAALQNTTPILGKAYFEPQDYDANNDLFSGFGFGINTTDEPQEEKGYYAKPVTVSIPRTLEPLPSILQDNKMNLLYFHHFLNHTARILVPHDCSDNPFKSILPQMARDDDNLLNLLLTYSASHRAKVLKHPEPTHRIAMWMNGVFPALCNALNDPSRQISDSNLATAIMLASLQILNPNTFGNAISWQQHLSVASQMILMRGGANSVHRKDKVSYFLIRWFAYLDVLGSLSGGKNDRPLFSGNYWSSNGPDDDQDYQIDCLLGFTSRCVSILAKIAELARTCDSERIDGAGNVSPYWQPSQETVEEAARLKNDLIEARQHHYKGCRHRQSSIAPADFESYSVELVTTNEAFHHAGFIHVNRRILGKPSTDPEVQFAVREIVSALYKVRDGGTAEGCLLFPMFTAGCEAQDNTQRRKIMERLERMEGLGMSAVKKARTLMEEVWETGKPWETLVSRDAFIG